jgi:hypothetical protein
MIATRLMRLEVGLFGVRSHWASSPGERYRGSEAAAARELETAAAWDNVTDECGVRRGQVEWKY